jgi:replicative DNA helicase
MTANTLVARLHEAEQLPKEQWQAALSLAVDAEQSLIGALLFDPENYGSIASIVRPHHFSESIHRHIFQAFEECRTAGRRGSLLEVRQALGPRLAALNIAGDVNLSQYVIRLSQEGAGLLPSDGARAVRDYWALRELFSAAMVGPEAMGLPDRVLRETFDKIDALRMDIAESSAARRSIGAIGADALARAERIADGLEEEPGVTTGLPELDRIMLGYRPGELVIIAGRPGMGKTTLATSSALACSAVELGGRTGGAGFFALELGEDAIGARCLADLAWSPHGAAPTHSAIRSGNLHADDRSRLHYASEALAKRALEIDGRSSTSIGEIEASCRAMQRRMERRGQQLRVVFVDYLKQVRASDRYKGQRVYEIGEITAGLRDIAKRLGICVVLAVQLNRGVESREDKRPTLADLRESGDIENDADVVLMVYREAYYLRRDLRNAIGDKAEELSLRLEGCENDLEILVPKNRNGDGEAMVKAFCDIGRSAVRPAYRGVG